METAVIRLKKTVTKMWIPIWRTKGFHQYTERYFYKDDVTLWPRKSWYTHFTLAKASSACFERVWWNIAPSTTRCIAHFDWISMIKGLKSALSYRFLPSNIKLGLKRYRLENRTILRTLFHSDDYKLSYERVHFITVPKRSARKIA